MRSWLPRLLYPGLRLLGRWQGLFAERLTPAGRFVLSATLFAGLLGVDTRANLSYQLFSVGLALLTVSLLSSWWQQRRWRGRMRIARLLPRFSQAGTPCPIGYRLFWDGRGQPHGFSLQEQLPDPRPSLALFLASELPDGEDINPVDRLLGYPLWRWLCEQGRWAEQRPSALGEALRPGQETPIEASLTPLRRGYLPLSRVVLSRADPLGLSRARIALDGRERLLVLPRTYPLRRPELPAGRRLQPGGVQLASSVGDSQEFIGLREYRSGDSPRHIHWPSWARCGIPQVKQFQDEYFTRYALFLDTFCPPRQAARLEAAVSIAASLCQDMQGRDSLLDLLLAGERVHHVQSGRSLADQAQLLEILACVEPGPESSLTLAERALNELAGQLSGLVCVLLDWSDARRAFGESLRRQGVPLSILYLSDQREPPAVRPGEPYPVRIDHLAEDLARL